MALTDKFVPTGRIKWSVSDFGKTDFAGVPGTLQASADGKIDLSRFTSFPGLDTTQLVILQEGTVDSYNTTADILRLTDGQLLNYTTSDGAKAVVF